MITTDYLSIGANRQAAGADWSRTGVLAYGADCNVALWRPAEPRGVFRLLSGHKETVKALTFLPEQEGDESTYLVSGADDGALVVWKSTSRGGEFEVVQTVSEHAGPINCIAALRVAGVEGRTRWIVATGAADASIKIWSFCEDKLRLLQTLPTSSKYFPLALSLAFLGPREDVLVLAAAGTRDLVQVFAAAAGDDDSVSFDLQATLTGHEGWIRSLSFARETSSPGSDVLLASASQDKYLRIWRIGRPGGDQGDALMPGPSNKAHRLKAAGQDFSIRFEALLLGHEDWIYSARWHAHADGRLQLLSASADNSLAIWEADASSGIWVSAVRLGEISREKGATTATGSTGGFWTGLWSPDGTSVACLGRTGSWRRWERDAEQDDWRPCVAVSGHVRPVTGIAWSRDGGYLLSTSADQTTRLHAQWNAGGTWHEMARPQIHGYDLNCIDTLGDSRFVSGADEKLMRVFDEPKAVATLLTRLCDIHGEAKLEEMPSAADMPVLGLSNKAITSEGDEGEGEAASYADADHPPLEETLSRHTLWPEREKLYGHGYEMSCLASSHDGTLVASACKASSANHAVIRLFETRGWTEVKPPLTAHSLTATRLRFSPDDRHLLSVGRDRQWAVFQREADGEGYTLLQANLKGHSRMILDAAWAPTGGMFATAGRDKQVRIWTLQHGAFVQTAASSFDSPVTAVDFLPREGGNILAVGEETGRIHICLVNEGITHLPSLPELALPKPVVQVSWRPAGEAYTLAIACEDTSLRTHTFQPEYFN